MRPLLILLTVFVIAAAIVIAACQPQQSQPPQQPECVSDSDCGVGGCSGQVCTAASEAAGIITTCEYRAEYDCLKLTGCGCVDGKCAWKETPSYRACIEKTKDI